VQVKYKLGMKNWHFSIENGARYDHIVTRDSRIFNDTENCTAFATDQLFKLIIFNCHFIFASGALNFCRK